MDLRAGFSSVDITPPETCPLMGYPFPGRNFSGRPQDVHCPLRARALVLRPEGEKPFVLLALDLAALPTGFAARIRAAVAAEAGTDVARTLVACSHTHSGPFASDPDDAGADGGPGEAGRAYGRFLTPRVAQAVRQAGALVYPVELSWRQLTAEFGYCRRAPRADGTACICWNPQEWPDRAPAPHPDPTLGVALLRQTNGSRRYVLWNLGMHAVVLGKTSAVVSADWPGRACELLDAESPATRSVFLQGASGEVHPWIATQEDPGHVDTVARAAAGAVSLAAQATQTLAHATPTLALDCTVGFAAREVTFTVWRLGDLAVVGLPVEFFASLSARIRRRARGPLLLATLANGWESYLPDAAAFEQGGYEVSAARAAGWSAGDGERLADAVIGQLAVAS